MAAILWVIAILFAIEQNSYFGWHAAPKSDAEIIVDGITMVLFALAAFGSRGV